MHPELITIAGRTIYWYGVMMALGFLTGVLIWRHLARRNGKPADYGSDLALWVLLPGLLGARVLYVIANWNYYLASPMEIWRIDHGGLIFYGGIIGGTMGALWFSRSRREPFLGLLDFLVVPVPLGHMFGRIGCFLNGCCYGLPVLANLDHPLGKAYGCGVTMVGDPVPRYPVQLFEAGGNLIIFAFLYWLYRRRPHHGLTLAVYLGLYPALRFGLEFLRGDDRCYYHGLTAAQWLSLALMTGACFLGSHAYRATRRNIFPVRGAGDRPTP